MKHLANLFLLLALTAGQAQELPRGWSAGYQLIQAGGDFGFGLQVKSAHFLKGAMSIRGRAHLMFLEHNENGLDTWSPYGQFTLGLTGWGMDLPGGLRAYGEGGLAFLTLNELSSKPVSLGGYGAFGLEYKVGGPMMFFLEMGGMGTGATADQLPGQPIVSNGFWASGGLVVYW
jgi:hypothetical protein